MIDFWFPLLIYKEILSADIDVDYLIKKSYSLKNTLPERVFGWYSNSFSTLNNYNYKQDNDPEILKLIEKIKPHVIKFSLEFGVKENESALECRDCWFNIHAPGQYQETHLHALSHFSAVYYLQTPKNSGNIMFRRPGMEHDMYPLPIMNAESKFPNYNQCSYPPEKNRLLIFRSNIPHLVLSNLSSDDRITMSFNFCFDMGRYR